MKMYIYNKVEKALKGLLPLMLLALVPSLTSCSDDDDNQSTNMTINKIFLEDTKAPDGNYDREVDFARLGQTIRIEGAGFSGLKYIYVNGFETYFNNALMTDNNVWVTLNSKTPVAKADESVRNTITFVKDNTQTVHQFTIRAASPNISSIDNTLPMAGEKVIIHGSSLDETTKITLPDGTEITEGIENDVDGEWCSFTMPAGVTASGSITTVGANGTAISPAYFNNNDCFIINFDGNVAMGSWSATFKAEDLVDDPLHSGRGKVAPLIPASYLEENPDGVKAGIGKLPYWATAGKDDTYNDWSRMTSAIPGTTPIDSVALQFDVYVPHEWDLSGQLVISLINNLTNGYYGSSETKYNEQYPGYAYAWVPWLDRTTGKHQAFSTGDRWQTITIPLSQFGQFTNTEKTWTFQNAIDARNAAGKDNKNFLIAFSNADLKYDKEAEDPEYPAVTCKPEVYVDNFRIVPYSAITVSDF